MTAVRGLDGFRRWVRGDSSPTPAPQVFPVPDALRRRTVLALLDVAHLRRFSAMAWIATWTVFLIVLGLGKIVLSSFDTISFIVISLGIALVIPGIASIMIGFFSSLHWGEEFRSIAGSPDRLALAWLPGIRQAKRFWNLARSFLWISWILGPAGIVAYYSVNLFGLYNTYSNPAGSSTTEALALLLLSPLIAFLFTRIAHHLFFAQSVSSAARELTNDKSSEWWQLGAFALPLDPIVVFLIALLGLILVQGPILSAGSENQILGMVVGAGFLSMLAAFGLAWGYWRIEENSRGWLSISRAPDPSHPDVLPPEWLGG